MSPAPSSPRPDSDASTGERIAYGSIGLAAYEGIVTASCALVWRCPRPTLVERVYRPHLGARHLSAGVASGAFLQQALRKVGRVEELHLLDQQLPPLQRTAERLAEHEPVLHQADLLEPLPPGVPRQYFDSADITLVLHCVHGSSMAAKSAAFDQLAQVLRPGGVLTGATILARGVRVPAQARALMALYNRIGLMTNLGDSRDDLEHELADRFDRVHVDVIGCMAVFSGTAR